jgi:hypothetical protein
MIKGSPPGGPFLLDGTGFANDIRYLKMGKDYNLKNMKKLFTTAIIAVLFITPAISQTDPAKSDKKLDKASRKVDKILKKDDKMFEQLEKGNVDKAKKKREKKHKKENRAEKKMLKAGM